MASNVLWEGVKATAGMVGQAALDTTKKGKLQTELVLLNRETEGRKRRFGVELYEYVEPLSKSPDFYAANDKMTDTLRGPLLGAQREISALDIKRSKLLEKLGDNESQQKGAYVTATTALERLQNAAKKTGFVSNHAKLKTELSMVDAQIRDFKELFGLEMYQVFVDLEDMEGWLPTVRDIRSIYDTARREVESIDGRRLDKEKEIIKLGGIPMTTSSETSRRKMEQEEEDQTPASSYFKQAKAAEGGAVVAAPPVSAPVNLADPFGTGNGGMPQQQQQPSHHDPFAMAPPPPQQQQQQQQHHDPFGTMAATNNDPFGTINVVPAPTSGPPGQWMDTSDRSFGSTPVLGTGGDPFVANPANNNDLLGNLNATADPFAAFDALQPQNNGSTTQPNPNGNPNENPLFRY